MEKNGEIPANQADGGQPEEKRGQDVILAAFLFESGVWNALSPGAQNIYIQLRRYSNAYGITRMSMDGLKKKTGLTTRQSLHRCLKELCGSGLIIKMLKPAKVVPFFNAMSGIHPNTWYFYLRIK